jgi:hypothetical protein
MVSTERNSIFVKAVFVAGLLGVAVIGGFFLYNIGTLISLMKELTSWLVATIGRLGYAGIVALMFLESSFFPVPWNSKWFERSRTVASSSPMRTPTRR